MSENNTNEFQLVIYEDDDVKLSLNTDKETVWTTQDEIAKLFKSSRTNIVEHISNIYQEGELLEADTLRKVGNSDNSFSKPKNYYNLDIIIAVGYRVNSLKATKFRRWATKVLKQFLISGYALNEEFLKNNPSKFQILLDKIREIRNSERMFYDKVKEVFSLTSADYEKGSEQANAFYAWAQNKFHFAITGQTAAEIVVDRLDGDKTAAGLTTYKGDQPTVEEAKVAKNYLTEDELRGRVNLSEQFLLYAESKALRKETMYMEKWLTKVNQLIEMNEMQVLYHKGKVSKEDKDKYVQKEMKKYRDNLNRLKQEEKKALKGKQVKK